MIRFRAGKRHGAARRPAGTRRREQARLADASREPRVAARIVAVDAAAENGDGRPPPASAPRCASPSIPRARPLTTTSRRPRARARACGRPGPVREQLRAPTTATHGRVSRSGPFAAQVNARGRIVELREQRRVRGVAPPDDRHVHPSSSVGERYESLGDVLGLDRRTRGECGDRDGRPRDARASSGRQRQRVDGAVEQRLRLGAERGASSRRRTAAASTRERTTAELSPTPVPLPRARARHLHDEVDAVEERARELLAVRGQALRRARALAAGSPRAPQGQRFMVATRRNRAGKTRAAR